MNYTTTITKGEGDDIIYVNIVALNTGETNIRANIDISRTAPIVQNTGEYLLSIVKFRIPTNLFPLFYFPTYPLTVSIEYMGQVISTNLIYTQTSFNELSDIYPAGVYSYQTFADMINTAIKTTYNSLSAPPSGVYIPFIVYNTDKKIFNMYYPTQWVDVYPYTTANIPRLYFNTDLNWYFQSFPTMTRNNQYPRDQQLIVENTLINKVDFPPIPSVSSFLMSQEYDTISLVNSLTNISITSNNIPVNTVDICTINIAGSSSSNRAISIIEDFDPTNSAGTQRSYQEYTASTFRYSSLYQKSNMYNINLAFYIYSQERDLYVPLYIAPKFTLSVKLCFKRRILNY